MKIKLLHLLFLSCTFISFSQSKISRVLWNKADNTPIEQATIAYGKNYSISNEDGIFEVEETSNKITIQSLIYEKLNVDFDFLKKNDTIYMQPITYELNEVLLTNDGLYTKMLKKVLTDYALEPHKEKFFLRAVVRKNGEFYKIVDFSGLVEKKMLFGTKAKPMPKKNYTVQINNIRKVGIENREIDFEMFDFKTFFNYTVRLAFDKNGFDITYETSQNKDLTKIILEPNKKDKIFFKGHYVLGDDNTFREANITYINNGTKFEKARKSRYKTTFLNWRPSFERNTKTNKLQLSKAKIIGKTEAFTNGVKDIFDVTYTYAAKPIDNSIELKNTINIKRDIFDLKGKYNADYWKNHEILPLTDEMQTFINKVNSTGKNSNFRTKSNIE